MREQVVLKSEKGAVFIWQAIVAVFIITFAAVGLVTSMYQAHNMLNSHYRKMQALDGLHSEMEYWKMRGFASASQIPIPGFLPPVIIDKRKLGSPLDWIYGHFEPRGRLTEASESANSVVKAWVIELHITWEEPNGAIRNESLQTAINHIL